LRFLEKPISSIGTIKAGTYLGVPTGNVCHLNRRKVVVFARKWIGLFFG
jgi:hypothetical protein